MGKKRSEQSERKESRKKLPSRQAKGAKLFHEGRNRKMDLSGGEKGGKLEREFPNGHSPEHLFSRKLPQKISPSGRQKTGKLVQPGKGP